MRDIDRENDAADMETEQLKNATLNIQKIQGLKECDIVLSALCETLEYSLRNANVNNPQELLDAMILQSHVLDSVFHNYVKDGLTMTEHKDRKIIMALRAQEQMVRTLETWKDLKTSTYVRYKLVKLAPSSAHRAKQTEQNSFDPFAKNNKDEDEDEDNA